MSDAIVPVRVFAALGHDVRLAVFRLLVRAGPDGVATGVLAAHLDLAPSTLAHHLAALVDAGIVTQVRQGRLVLNRVDMARLRGALDFLMAECCAGLPGVSESDAA